MIKRYIRAGDTTEYWAEVGRCDDMECFRSNPDKLRAEDEILDDEHKDKILKLRRQLRHSIRRLPPSCRRTLRLYYFQGMTQIEIALVFGVTRWNVRKQLTNSIAKLKQLMEGELV